MQRCDMFVHRNLTHSFTSFESYLFKVFECPYIQLNNTCTNIQIKQEKKQEGRGPRRSQENDLKQCNLHHRQNSRRYESQKVLAITT